jgi:hypothetical protein
LRRIAKAPRFAQEAIADGMTAQERDELRPRLQQEIKRLRALRGQVKRNRG